MILFDHKTESLSTPFKKTIYVLILKQQTIKIGPVGTENTAVIKVIEMQTGGPEFKPENPSEMPGMLMGTCHPSAEVDTGKSLELVG